MNALRLLALLGIASLSAAWSAGARAQAASGRVVDRAVVRFSAPETGGTENPQFIFERQLAFEARLVALADPAHQGEPFRRHHLQAALERHIAEELLSSLPLDEPPAPDEMRRQVELAREIAEQQAGGGRVLARAASAEGISRLELRNLFSRRARASLYLDRMVAPMLGPTELTLRQVHRIEDTPFSDEPYADVREQLRRWYVAEQLKAAAIRFYQNARARLRIEFLDTP